MVDEIDPRVLVAEARRENGERAASELMSSVPRRFESALIENIEDEELRTRLNEWDDERMPMFYSPNPGTGKTFVAIAFAQKIALEQGYRFRYVSLSRLFAEMRLAMNGGEPVRPPIGEPVILDDIDKARSSEWVREWLFILIDTAWSECLPVIATTNMDSKGVAVAVGEATADRLRDMLVTVPVLGDSRRGT